tara:strand:- start:2496 stop:3422 length:927 start_codon:yes stop_codon:yes gene_type:complete
MGDEEESEDQKLRESVKDYSELKRELVSQRFLKIFSFGSDFFIPLFMIGFFSLFLFCIFTFFKGEKISGTSSLNNMNLSFTNIFKLFSFIIPFFLIFFILLFSIFSNNSSKGLLFLCGVVILIIINYILKFIFAVKQNREIAGIYCNALPPPFTAYGNIDIYTTPSINSTLLSYTCTYIFYSIFANHRKNPQQRQINYSLVILFFGLFLVSSITEVFNKCCSSLSILVGFILGLVFGIVYKNLISLVSGNDGSDLSDLTTFEQNSFLCKPPSRKNYICSIKQDNEEREEREDSAFWNHISRMENVQNL